ncbi:MAG: PHP domain-containing protein [Mollicutes bacterium]|nr:PHP domain-containing protein [Mollicutes bacterium]
MRYENYHKHTHYSNITTLDVVVKPEDYMKRAKELGHKIYFTTEHGYNGNIYEALTLAEKYDLKVVSGMEAYYVPDRKGKDKSNYHLVLIALNTDGYKDLNYLLSESNVSGFYYKPRIDDELLFSINPKNIIVTTACVAGRLREEQGREEWILKMKNYFKDNFYLEVQSHPCETQANYNKIVLYYHNKYNIPIIHANDSHYIFPEDAKYRNKFLQAKGLNYPEEDNFILDYPDSNTIIERYKKQGVLNDNQIQEALNNTLIFDKAEKLDINKEIKMPIISINPLKELKTILNEAWIKERKNIPKSEWNKYLSEIRTETKVVEDTNMAEYFLLNYYIIKKSVEKYNGVITKTGRGSAPSFYINKLLGFTNIDRISAPITLFPSRFMSKTRILESHSLPDIDFNCADTQPFYEASKELLGKDGCYWMIAYKPLQTSSAFRLWCKSEGLNINEYNAVAMDLAELSKVKKPYTESMYYKDEKWKKLIDESQHFVGVIESLSQHPCSTLLMDKPISREVGLIKAGDVICANITSYESDNYKFLKNDLLTVSVWSLINDTCKLAGINTPSIAELNSKLDEKTWEIYEKGLTCSINQADSDYATGLVQTYKPHSVAEMSAFVACIRPGCASLLQDFIHRKPYTTGVEKLDELLIDGAHRMIYQELIMKYLIWLGIKEDNSYGIIKKIAKKKFKEQELKELKDKLLKGWIKQVGKQDHFEESWQIVEDAARYSFNCLAGDTRIQRLGQKINAFNPTIEEMYLIKNDYEYAKKTGHISLYKKYNRQGYGNAFSMFDDNRIHKNKIVDIYFTGKQKIYRVKTSSGCYVDCTLNHSFPTPTGKKKLKELSLGDDLYIKGVYEKHPDNYRFTNGRNKVMEKGIPTKIEKIISIEYLREDNVYDIEMESPAHNFISESGLVVSNCSHSLAYAYDSIYGAYLKSHYPLEYYTVALNSYQGDFDRTNKLTQELEYFKIKISSPKFRYSFGEYSCDKNTNTIYKGISSIKGLSKTIGDKLYSLKDNTYPTFLDLLIDCKEQKIGISDLTILAKLDYFSEFGTIGKILKFLEIYNKLYGKKLIKKDQNYPVKKLYLKKFCSKETEKQYTGFNSEDCLRDLFSKIPNEDIPIIEKLNYQLQYFGYVEIVDSNVKNSIWFVTDIVERGKNKIVGLYKVCSGEKKKVKLRNTIFNENPFKEGSLIDVYSFSKEGRWLKDKDGNWERSVTQFEDFLTSYEIKNKNF